MVNVRKTGILQSRRSWGDWFFDEIDEYVDGSFLLSGELDQIIVQRTTRECIQVSEKILCIFNISWPPFSPMVTASFLPVSSR